MVQSLVHVLLATYNGAAHLPEQLESLAQQTGVQVKLYVSDDGSTDDTLMQLGQFDAWPVELLPPGPRLGATGNFFRLMRWVADRVQADEWVAFCDQDDIWLPDKLQRAVSALQGLDMHSPLAYAGRTLIVDPHNREWALSALQQRAPGFANALVQCMAGANTLVFNARALELMLRPPLHELSSHDWWCYLVVTACGGQYLYDPKPCLRYRQHVGNEVGFNQGWRAKWQRLLKLVDGQFGQWTGQNQRALNALAPLWTESTRACYAAFERARSAPWVWQRLWAFWRSGVYRHSRVQTLALALACALRRL